MNNTMQPILLYGVPFSQPVRAVMWLMLYKRLPFEMVLINPGSKGDTGALSTYLHRCNHPERDRRSHCWFFSGSQR